MPAFSELAVHKNNNFKGSIYMVFDYADYDLTGLMETVKYKFTEAQVHAGQTLSCWLPAAIALAWRRTCLWGLSPQLISGCTKAKASAQHGLRSCKQSSWQLTQVVSQ